MAYVAITEQVLTQPSLSVDEATNTIKGVRVLNRRSKNNRLYTDRAQESIVAKLDGLHSYIDHKVPDRSGKTRTVRELLGVFHVPTKLQDGVSADFAVSAKEKWLLEDAQKNPDMVCFSISGSGDVDTKSTPNVVNDIATLESVDLVARGGTTKSLFEAQEPNTEEDSMDFTKLTLTDLREQRPDIAEAIEKAATADTAKDKELTETAQKLADATSKLEEANAKIDEHEAAKAVAAKLVVVAEKLKASKLPDEAITDHFRESLAALTPEQIDAAITDRKALVENTTVHDGGGSARKTGGDGGGEQSGKQLYEAFKA